jgi:hypothetical protein
MLECSFSCSLFGVIINEFIRYFPFFENMVHPHLMLAFVSSIIPLIVNMAFYPRFRWNSCLLNFQSFTVPSNDPDATLQRH